MRIEDVIFENLVVNEAYSRKVVAFLKEDYFKESADRLLFGVIDHHIAKYNVIPDKDSIELTIEAKLDVPKHDKQKVYDLINSWTGEIREKDLQFLIDQTEEFCKERSLYNALHKAIKIADGGDKQLSKGAIPQLLQDALAVSFDTNIGHDFIEDAMQRFDWYKQSHKRLPFSLELMNKITGGGLISKTLNVILAGTGVGKSLFMCSEAAHHLRMGKNVLYITMEMSEEKIAQRIDANLLDINIAEFPSVLKTTYETRMANLRKHVKGKLIVKEYPTSSANASHFRYLLNELRIKKNFVPDVIYIDYLNICSSSRLKAMHASNTYVYVKAIAEELRGLAVEFDVPIISATQVNRSGFNDSDVEITNTSESFGLPATVDLMFALISNEELEKLQQMMVKQLKNRYNDVNFLKRFVIGVDRAHMRFYDVEESAQTLCNADVPVFDQTEVAEQEQRRKKISKFERLM